MLAIQILVLFLLLIVVPMLAGEIFDNREAGISGLMLRWVSGQMLLWAGFQLICVPLILKPKGNSFRFLILLYGIFAAAVLLMSVGVSIRRKAGGGAELPRQKGREKDKAVLLLGAAVVMLLILQQILAGILAYEEGDDAFYVATASVTASSETMYQILPYTGGTTALDARHGLAPFPIWVAMLAKLSGMHAATVSQIVLPVVLIAMAYSVFYLIACRLFPEKRRAALFFLLLLELLVIFGGHSLYTAENFLLVRTAQGKAVLADIVIPFSFFLLLRLFEGLEKGEKPGIHFWLLLGMTMVSGCLCSTLGALLVCLLLAAGGCCAAACYGKWKILVGMTVCAVVPAIMALLYLKLG